MDINDFPRVGSFDLSLLNPIDDDGKAVRMIDRWLLLHLRWWLLR
jgi:hypothetical protein